MRVLKPLPLRWYGPEFRDCLIKLQVLQNLMAGNLEVLNSPDSLIGSMPTASPVYADYRVKHVSGEFACYVSARLT
ncbi:hypothetical protein SBA6_40061 [Candidatus Sulfopaludibacter sp. SbA6]|nr:hypothetical protein SBA6_40061 [Candidatus Sulfopaludibacter sp. SbA6]